MPGPGRMDLALINARFPSSCSLFSFAVANLHSSILCVRTVAELKAGLCAASVYCHGRFIAANFQFWLMSLDGIQVDLCPLSFQQLASGPKSGLRCGFPFVISPASVKRRIRDWQHEKENVQQDQGSPHPIAFAV